MRFGARDIGDPGYESATGYGILSVGGALARQAPPADPAEPNDDIRFVNGRAFGGPPRPSSARTAGPRPSAPRPTSAEDPIDVYQIKVRAGSRAKIRLAPSVGDPDLYVFRGGARSVGAAPLARSRKGPGKTDSATVRNRKGRTATYFVAVGFSRDKRLRLLNASYSAARQPLRRSARYGRIACGTHCSSARSPVPSSAAGVGTCGLSRRYHSASSAAWQPMPAAVTAWRYVWSTRSPAANMPGTRVRVERPSTAT